MPNSQGNMFIPVQLSSDYEAVQEEVTAVLAANVTSFFSFEAIRISNNLGERCYVILLPMCYKETRPSQLVRTLAGIVERGSLHLLMIYGSVGQGYIGQFYAKNIDRYLSVKNGASIGLPGRYWTGSCAHHLCAHEWRNPGLLSDEKLVELVADGQEIIQPSTADEARLHSFEEFIARRFNSYRSLEKKKYVDEPTDSTFGVTTGLSELCVDQGTLWDYALIEITQQRRQGLNTIDSTFLTQPSMDYDEPIQEHFRMVGRTTGSMGGTFRGYRGDAKVERIKTPFRCLYAWGEEKMCDPGDAGAWFCLGSKAVGYMLGGGTSEDIPIGIMLVADLEKVCWRILDKYGIELIVAD
ncbi:hypothetical protein EDC01DRAFT_677159 [Geopyxis carbonaria]|nr:hypothetical protein EDC01DRAFT_677159 [Geopyxis carbonaria]